GGGRFGIGLAVLPSRSAVASGAGRPGGAAEPTERLGGEDAGLRERAVGDDDGTSVRPGRAVAAVAALAAGAALRSDLRRYVLALLLVVLAGAVAAGAAGAARPALAEHEDRQGALDRVDGEVEIGGREALAAEPAVAGRAAGISGLGGHRHGALHLFRAIGAGDGVGAGNRGSGPGSPKDSRAAAGVRELDQDIGCGHGFSLERLSLSKLTEAAGRSGPPACRGSG